MKNNLTKLYTRGEIFSLQINVSHIIECLINMRKPVLNNRKVLTCLMKKLIPKAKLIGTLSLGIHKFKD